MNRLFVFLFVSLISTSAFSQQPYTPYNQNYTMNQQYGSSNWYSSPLGMGAAQMGVMLMGGIVNAMSRPDNVVVQQAPAQAPVQYAPQQYGGGYGGGVGFGGGQCNWVPYYGYGPQNPQMVPSCR